MRVKAPAAVGAALALALLGGCVESGPGQYGGGQAQVPVFVPQAYQMPVEPFLNRQPQQVTCATQFGTTTVICRSY